MANREPRLARLPVAAALCFCLAGAGCGSGKITVEGNVTFAGKPVEEGTIVLEPADGQGLTCGGKIERGQYSLSGEAGTTPGRKIVRIRAFGKTGRKVPPGPLGPAGALVEETKQ